MNEATPPPEQLYRTSWIVLGAMVAGLAIFAGVAVFVRTEAAATAVPWPWIWAALGPLSVVLAKLFQRRAGSATPVDVATAHVFPWSIVEGPALLGIVAYLMGASGALLLASLLTAALGFAITAPTREAFGLG